MLDKMGHGRFGNPGVGKKDVFPLRHVAVKVVELRHAIFLDRTGPRIQFLEVEFPVAPLQAIDIVAHVDDDRFAPGFLLLTHKEIGHFDAVDHAVIRNLATGDFRQGGEEIHLVDNFVTGCSGRYLTGPADGEGNTQASFKAGKQGAAPWAGTPLAGGFERGHVVAVHHLRPVIGCEDNDRVFPNAQIVNRIEYSAGVGVDLHQHVCPGPIA